MSGKSLPSRRTIRSSIKMEMEKVIKVERVSAGATKMVAAPVVGVDEDWLSDEEWTTTLNWQSGNEWCCWQQRHKRSIWNYHFCLWRRRRLRRWKKLGRHQWRSQWTGGRVAGIVASTGAVQERGMVRVFLAAVRELHVTAKAIVLPNGSSTGDVGHLRPLCWTIHQVERDVYGC